MKGSKNAWEVEKNFQQMKADAGLKSKGGRVVKGISNDDLKDTDGVNYPKLKRQGSYKRKLSRGSSRDY